MKEKNRKTFYWLFKSLSVFISCAFPVWAIYEKFPMWNIHYGTTRTIGVGGVLAVMVVLIIFRKAVFAYIRDKLNITHAPPLAVWLVLMVISYALIFVGDFLKDVTIILWMGLIGCAIGTFLTFIAENAFGKKTETGDGKNG